jgi:KRAB domain-containing zinc finger protein
VHIRSKHEGIQYKCDNCEKDFADKSYLRLHRRVVHEGKKIKCELCDYEAVRRSIVEYHKKTIHEGIRFKCDKCEFETKVRKYLAVHTKREHEGQLFKCTLCDYSSKGHQLLKRHQSVKHEGVKYNCDQCAYSVTSRRPLKRHMSEGVHKVQACGQCNELFDDPERLVRHLLKHEGKKPFPCDQCESSYTTLSALQKHQRSVHTTDSKEPEKDADDHQINSTEIDSLSLKIEPKTEPKSERKPDKKLLTDPYQLMCKLETR